MQISGSSSPETASQTQPANARSTPPTRKRFALTGRSHAFDPRVDAARGDLADIRLADRLFAPHYAAAVSRTAIARAPIRAALAKGALPLSEILPGEDFDILELSHGQAWGVSVVDGAVGFVDIAALGPTTAAGHVVATPHADPLVGGAGLPMGARVSDPSLFDASAVRTIGEPHDDFVELAEALVGTPFAAGGRSGAGVDAPGLVFLTLSLSGIAAPRFADLQAERLGHAVGDGAPMLRGDLLYFERDVAIVADNDTAITAGEAGVEAKPIAALIEAAGPIITRRRLP